MEEIKLMEELKKNCETNREKLSELMKVFDLCVLGYEIQEQRCNDVYNKVLSENEFLAEKDCERLGVKAGERIKDETSAFLLSDKDFDRMQTLAHPIFVEDEITDENGRFIDDWIGMKVSARNELVEFIIQKIVPSEMREVFLKARKNITQMDKLINITRSVA